MIKTKQFIFSLFLLCNVLVLSKNGLQKVHYTNVTACNKCKIPFNIYEKCGHRTDFHLCKNVDL